MNFNSFCDIPSGKTACEPADMAANHFSTDNAHK